MECRILIETSDPERRQDQGRTSPGTLKFFFGTDHFNFTMDSTVAGLTNPVRHYTGFSQALDDILEACLYGGMHFRNSNQKGAIIGKQVSRYVTTHYFLPSRGRND